MNNSRDLSKIDFTDITDDSLFSILLTDDGHGKDAKERALNELLNRKFSEGYGCGANSICTT